MAQRVVVALERVEVEHQDRERPAQADRFAHLALERSVVAQAGQRVLLGTDADLAVGLGVLHRDRGLAGEQLGQLELVVGEVRLGLAHPADVQRADGLARHEQRNDDHGLGLEWGARHLDGARVEVGGVGEDRLAVVDDPARDADAELALVGEDQLGEAVAGDDRATDIGAAVHPVHGQRVVRHDRLERVGDEVQDAGRIQRGEQPLVDLEQASLAFELQLELGLLEMQPLEVRGVDQGLCRGGREDRQRGLVVGVEAIRAKRRDHDDAVDLLLVRHRHDEHRFGLLRVADDDAARVVRRVAETQRAAVLGDPAREALADAHAQLGRLRIAQPQEGALERDRLADAAVVVDEVHPDRVVLDEALGLADDGPRDLVDLVDVAQADGELRDRGQAIGHRPARLGQASTADGRGHVVAEGAGQIELVGGPGVLVAVVQDEQAERLVAEDDRDVADRADADPAVDGAQAWRRGPHRRVEDADAAFVDGLHAGRRRVMGQVFDGLDDLAAEATRGGEGQWRRATRVVAPQPGPLDAEEPERLIDDVIEQALQIVATADLRRDASQGVGTGAAARDLASRGVRRTVAAAPGRRQRWDRRVAGGVVMGVSEARRGPFAGRRSSARTMGRCATSISGGPSRGPSLGRRQGNGTVRCYRGDSPSVPRPAGVRGRYAPSPTESTRSATESRSRSASARSPASRGRCARRSTRARRPRGPCATSAGESPITATRSGVVARAWHTANTASGAGFMAKPSSPQTIAPTSSGRREGAGRRRWRPGRRS